MSILTVWTNAASEVKLHQLSGDPEDGAASEQIEHLSTLDVFSGWSCVDPDFTGSVPGGDVANWRWSDGQIIAAPVVPEYITAAQARLFLLSQNLLDEANALIAQQSEAAQIEWQYRDKFYRNGSVLLATVQEMGLTSEQVDQFFIAASAI